jgi:hypothetical protein
MKNWDEMNNDEKNSWIATNVMGLYVSDGYYQISCPDGVAGCCVWHGRKVPDYINEISVAWEVVEKIGQNKFNFQVLRRSDGRYFVTCKKVGSVNDKLFEVYTKADLASAAICKAAYLSYNTK